MLSFQYWFEQKKKGAEIYDDIRAKGHLYKENRRHRIYHKKRESARHQARYGGCDNRLNQTGTGTWGQACGENLSFRGGCV